MADILSWVKEQERGDRHDESRGLLVLSCCFLAAVTLLKPFLDEDNVLFDVLRWAAAVNVPIAWAKRDWLPLAPIAAIAAILIVFQLRVG